LATTRANASDADRDQAQQPEQQAEDIDEVGGLLGLFAQVGPGSADGQIGREV
jgi:hypothetical protein